MQLSSDDGETRSRLIARRFFSRKVRLTVIFSVTSILLTLNLVDFIGFFTTDPRNSDFFHYQFAARMGLTRGWPTMYDPKIYMPALWEASHRWMPYLNPPPMAWLVIPFTWLPFPIALTIWTSAMFAAILLAWRLLARGSRADRLAHLHATLGLYLVQIALRLGQVVSLVLAGVATCWWLIGRRKPLLAGMALGVMVLKPQATLLVPVALLCAGYRRVFLGWVLVVAPLTVASLLAMGAAGIQNFERGSQIVYDGLVPGATLASPNSILPGAAAVVIGVTAAGITMATAWRARGRGPELPIAAGLVGSTLIAPYLFIYDLGGLMLSAWLALRAGVPSWLKVAMAIGYLPLALDHGGASHVPVLVLQCAWMATVFALGFPRDQGAAIALGAGPATDQRVAA